MGVIKKQGILNSIITYSGIAIGFVSLLLIQPHFLTKEELGLTRILLSFSGLVATFMPLGIHSITIKYFPFFRDREKRHYGFFGFMLLFPLTGFLLVSALFLLFKPFIIEHYSIHSELFTHYFYLLFPFTFFLGFISVLGSYSYSLFKTSAPAFLNEVFTKAMLIVPIALYYFEYISLDTFILLYVMVFGLQMLLLLGYILIVDKPGIKIDMGFLKQQNPSGMVGFGFLLSLAALSGMGLRYVDTIMLGLYKPVIEGYNALDIIGIYTIAAFIPVVIEAPFNALDKITSAKLGHAWAHNNRSEVQEIYFKSTKYLMLIGGILFIGVNINIDTLLHMLPKDYSLGVNVVRIISVGAFINMATGVNDSVLFNSGKYKAGVYMLVIIFVVAILNNKFLIPVMGMEGAALSAAISSLLYNFMKFLFIKKNFQLQPFDRKSALILLLVVICFLVNGLIPSIENSVADIAIRSFILTLTYTTGAYFFKIVPEFHRHIPFLGKK